MPKAYYSAVLDRAAGDVWALVRDFNNCPVTSKAWTKVPSRMKNLVIASAQSGGFGTVASGFASVWLRFLTWIAASPTRAANRFASLLKMVQRTGSRRSTMRGPFALRRSWMGTEHLSSGG